MAAVSLCFPGVSRLCRGVFGGVCFENFIVDASIFVDFVVVASYLVRSVDALAPRADEGRCNLR